MYEADVQHWADVIVMARRYGWLLDPISDKVPLTLDDAYAIQARVLSARIERGERRIGWKLGYTSLSMREQMGIDLPNFAPLTNRMVMHDGEIISDRVIQPRVEPEIALVLSRPVSAGATPEQVLAACAQPRAVLEVVDPVWRDYRFRLEDNTADGSSAAYVVLGPQLKGCGDLSRLRVELACDGRPVAEATGAAAMGHPAQAVAWLATELAAHGGRLEPGDIIITGGLTAAVPLPAGGTVSATFGGLFGIGVSRSGRRSA
ncbi:fumarylacetoacetate hydrolase family protein [Streptomyces sp. RB6PN25]|uniref:Fumarylacetoacetate hydrolase family protein n=1 Tax=Streptomyces humicola TaxID=2953240 RepID=A0ABT1PN74_9ACTN|nr:fumarylacetoacetate hydrolase family protein [Streptomyces humicola]MCQ4079122.1 fumarylacetoacetate hydrolase family protein [Streptomyces humicola]